MAQLIILVVAAAWLAVLIPPMLRSRVENRPNSSVTDFRRQLDKLQSTATPPRGSMRAMGRPLVSSPLHRPAAAGRPNQPVMRSGLTRHTAPSETRAASPVMAPTGPGRTRTAVEHGRYRTHGDPSGGQRRPVARTQQPHAGPRRHGDPSGARRRPTPPAPAARRSPAPMSDVKRRRSNVLFGLVVVTACTLFLAATTSSTVMVYVFAVSFLALGGYVYKLTQMRERVPAAHGFDGWLDR